MTWLKQSTRLSVVMLLMTLLGVAVWYAMPSIVHWQKRNIARELYANLQELPDDQVRASLFQISELGTPGLDVLVTATGSQRHAIAEVSREVLEREVTKRRILASKGYQIEVGEWTAELATSLSQHDSGLGFAGKQWVATMTLKMVDMAEGFAPEHAVLVLAKAEEILDAIPPLGPRMQTMSRGTIQANRALPQPSEPGVPLELMAIPSERIIEVEGKAHQPIPTQVATRQEVVPIQPEAGPLTRSVPDWQPEWQEKSPQIPDTPPSNPELPVVATPTEKVPPNPLAVVIDVPTPDDTRRYAEKYRGVSSEVLFDQLPLVDFYQAGAMRAILKERGFDDRELQMIQRMTSVDAKERLGVIEDLSELPASRARHWLKRLIRDKDGEVRFRALSAIATTQDPQLYEIAKDLALHDNDERIVKLATGIMKRMR